MGMSHDRPSVLGVTPFEVPNAHLAAALARAGAVSVLDLGHDAARAREALTDATRFWAGDLAVRVPAGCPLTPADLPAAVTAVVLPVDVLTAVAAWSAAACAPRTVLAEVVSAGEAAAAVAAGATGLIAKGAEAGGRVGSTSTFVLLQQLLAMDLGVPVYAAGGIGPHTAAAAVAGGAAGVVLDAQLALVAEAELPREVAAAITAMDGTETAVVDGRRVLARPGAPALPVGEDGALAKPLADRHRTAGGVVRAVREAIETQIRTAAAAGSTPRVAQGPMTRVSDQAAFAKAVADDGGLPFIALALMSGDDARALLTETAELLGDRPWGVGILGFVPQQVREAQLAAVHDIHPPYALIAGGRPAQAAPLEAAGITTFLHVPSPGLLDRFLAEGARRFVFEGSECGGHVGPRASFPLWELQIQRLLDHADRTGCAAELDVLFAGGIHDERSAAMVSAAAAPIVARGGRAGVLMGTAYLFTAEAVASGAIGPAFQRAALACENTVLLETAPGHATRCAESEFVRTFSETRERLTAEGMPREQMWAELEKLNLGRLRIASKGIRREGGALIPVDETTQARDGMVMIGDVAVLRKAVTTVAELHRQVTEGAAEFLSVRAAELGLTATGPDRATGPEPLDVAIVGMAGVFPQAGDLAEFWANVLADHDAITEVPADRWDPSTYFNGDGGQGSTSKWGGFLPDIPFDALKYGIPPAALASIEPVQLLSLEVAARALKDAGYAAATEPGRPFARDRAGVIFGAEPGTDLSAAYGFRALYPALHGELPAELDEQLPALTEDSFPGVLANVIAGRIANRLDLGGANYTVDAACASALAALEVACMQLRAGAADMVLAGGADIHNGIQDYLMFASVGALSPTGHCKPFDAQADGISLGEGVACVVLKRLADAERDGDRIYAVIKGVGSSSDGRSLGLTAPRPEGQRRALERAYAMAGISPADVGLVEAHGTGTVVGDRTELGVLTEVFTEAGATPGSCALGSVKSQIGHTKCTAGLAGLIKAARAVHAGVLPPTGKIGSPNPAWVGGTSPFVFDSAARPWPAGRPRVAGVSAFGFGGTNFHAVVAAYTGAPLPRSGSDAWPAELFCFTGSTEAATGAEIDRMRALCAANDEAGRPWRLRDLARTAAERSAPERGGRVRVALVATDLDDLAAKLEAARTGAPTVGVFRADDEAGTRNGAGELAFLFPGQGSQRPGMLGDLFATFPRLQHLLATGAQWAPLMFPPATFTPEAAAAAKAALTDTRVAQPALGMADLAMYETLTGVGVRPDHLGGHSYGELVALAAGGALDVAELLELSAARGRAILAAAGEDPGTMAAVSAGADDIKRVLNGTPVVVANHNGPAQTVISGPTAAIETALGKLSAAGLSAQKIPVACAFHSPVVAEAATTLAAELSRRTVTAPHLPVWSNTTASPYPMGATAVRDTLADQVAQPVRFTEQIEAMYAAGVRTFVECGPGRVLTGLVGSILGDRPHVAVATDAPGRRGVHSLLLALGRLAVAGVPVDAGALFAGRDAEVVSVERAPRRPGWIVNGHLVKTAQGSPVANGLRPATPVAPVAAEPVVTPAAVVPAAAPVPGDGREAVVLEFLRSTREIVAAQRDIVLGYLGAAPAAPATVAQPTVAPATVAQPAAAVRPAAEALPAKVAPVIPAQVAPAEVAPAEVAPAAPAGVGADDVMAALVDIVATRTGYPAEMLGADLDLEADLSIASLKRTEILGLLADRLPAAGLDEHKQAELSRLRTLRAIVDAVGTPAPAAPGAPAPAPLAPAAAPAAAPAELGPDDIMAALVDIVATRTGYPAEMLGADLDLEADLSIASLKRTEILGLLADRLSAQFPGAESLDEHKQAELSRLRTLRAIVDAVAGVPAPAKPALTVVHNEELPAPDPVAAALAVVPRPGSARPAAPRRYLLEPVPMAPAPAVGDLTGRHVTIVTGGVDLGSALSALLAERGAAIRTVSASPDTELGDVDILVHLGAACPTDPPSLPEAFALLRKAVLGGARQLLVVTGTGGRFGHRPNGEAPPLTDAPAGMGLPGLVRTIAREYPEIAARAVDLDPKESPSVLAGRLLGELLNPVGPEVVGHAGDTRYTLDLVRAPLSPAKERAGRKATIGISPDSVVLLTGGARGITARVALGLAKATGCHVVLWGRTPLPTADEDPLTAGARDAVALRRAIIATGITTPAEVEAASRRILADREIRSAMTQLTACAASVHYATVDVRDPEAVRAGVDAVYARYGRLDGVVHGAGVLDDKLIADKTPEGFASVWQTKVDGARSLAAAVSRDLRFLVLFGSVSGVFGNRGQCDYAAANDAMDCLARHWAGSFSGRVLSIDWGPWLPTDDGSDSSGNGMVSDALLKQYARDGVEAIHPDDGVDCMIAELAHGAEPQVVYVCAEPSAFDVAFGGANSPSR